MQDIDHPSVSIFKSQFAHKIIMAARRTELAQIVNEANFGYKFFFLFLILFLYFFFNRLCLSDIFFGIISRFQADIKKIQPETENNKKAK